MSLYSEWRRPIHRVTREDFFDSHYWRMSATERAALEAEIGRVLDSGRIHTTSWVPGADWSGTPYQPIYEIACDENWYKAHRR